MRNLCKTCRVHQWCSSYVCVSCSSVNNHRAPPPHTVTEPPSSVYTSQVALCVSVCLRFVSWTPLHSPCYHHNASVLHQLNMGLLPLAWCETFRKGGVAQVGATGWGHSVGGWCLARIRNIINLRDAFLTPWLSACVSVCKCLRSSSHVLRAEKDRYADKTHKKI